ncbi:hypothetical protein MPTK1_7g08480 [Marchantia polymorpha subsp. ruderalis]|uniref:HNH domain-containing protein n=2 Tax=Marchantia polymorpha TaxID=3197 RepID=A0AAF6BXF3_MARPO|nr:hypothetical protein MARPO_0068s0002 [Marchantia polymorpha]BBN16687.1 hypothetical protein Mp_7g08480 [Marchantia polymorpha subsp. ruderalis]|eukprot:PTQ35769.1 hypothetical protein MARPO_0068s0002 [Marchantia polymorpha]
MESLEEYPVVDKESREKGGRNARKLRIFDEKMRNLCWQKADVVPGRHPERWRKDGAGNVVCRSLTRCTGCLCYEYDHIQPYSKGLSLISLPMVVTPRTLFGLVSDELFACTNQA